MEKKEHVRINLRLEKKAYDILHTVATSRGVTMTLLMEQAIYAMYSGEAAAIKVAAKNGVGDE
ncbi:MAG: hypothetical protein M9928_21825 [Anaerolineae bacterium]|nr:hypothetical protein [Anaerolineae bacterium]MCO5207655.1 hypothetical protein [Anaerolineae bacterium]